MKSSSTDFSSKYIVLLFAIIIILLVGLEWFLRYYIITIPRSTPNVIKKSYDNNNKVIVIGDSHFYRGFIGSSKVLNLSKGGFTIPVVHEIFKQIPDKNGKNIIFEASPQLFSQRHLDWGVRGFDEYFVLPSFFQVYLFEPGVTQYLSSITGFDVLKSVLTKNWPDDENKLSSWELTDPKQRFELTQSRVRLHRPFLNTEQALHYKQRFEQMLTQAVEQGMIVCVLRTPVDTNYLDLISDQTDYNEAIKFFKDVANSKGVRYVDFRDLDMSFGFEQFMNQDHLTPKASKKFVPLVMQRCGF